MIKFVHQYRGIFKYYRVEENNFKKLKSLYSKATCLVIFPAFQSSDILYFAKNSIKIPAGITRHIVADRALHVKIPLQLLKDKKALGYKNNLLQKHLSTKMEKSKIRHYTEPVFMFYD